MTAEDPWIVSCREADWTVVPKEFAYIIEPAKQLGLRRMIWYARNNDDIVWSMDEMNQLKQCAEILLRMGHLQPLTSWIYQHPNEPKTDCKEMVASLLEEMDLSGLLG